MPGRTRARRTEPAGPWRSGQGGFTLIELVTVVALIGLLFFVAIPRFAAVFEVGPMDRVINHISAKVRALRDSAIKTQETKYLFIDFSNRKIGSTGAVQDPSNPDTENKAGFLLPEDVDITDVEFPGNTVSSGVVEFAVSPRGYISHAAVHLENRDGRKATLFLEPFLGKVRVAKDHVGLQKQ